MQTVGRAFAFFHCTGGLLAPKTAVAMIDENAFGILLSYFDVEEDEYGLEDKAEFVEKFKQFQEVALELLQRAELPEEHRCVCLGHSVYAEFTDDEENPGLFSAVRNTAARLERLGFSNIAVLSHGSRWVQADTEKPPKVRQEGEGAREVILLTPPSEPFRRALNAESMARPDDELGGWGAGVYMDTEAVEALGRQPKNAPTVLRASGAGFYRIPPLALPAEVAP